MSLTLTVPPIAASLTLAEIKDHLRVTGAEEDVLIASFSAAAQRMVEARTGLALSPQDWRLTLDAPPTDILRLPLAPVTAIHELSVSGVDVGPDAFAVELGAPGRIKKTGPWPAVLNPFGALVIDFTVGYASPDMAPPPLLQAVRLLTAHFYENREAVASTRGYAIPEAVDVLIAPYRELRL